MGRLAHRPSNSPQVWLDRNRVLMAPAHNLSVRSDFATRSAGAELAHVLNDDG
jgi:hypothetical protein